MGMIVVCGDSFMAPDPQAPGRHFSEIMGAVSLAKPGCSNTDICFQIEQAIRLQAHRVIIGTTDPARIELKLTEQQLPSVELENFRNGQYASDTIPTFIGEESDIKYKYQLSSTRRQAVKQYFTEMFDPVLKSITDRWNLEYFLVQLEKNHIRYTVLRRDFVVYQYAQAHPNEPYWFHTNFATQHEAANLLLQQ
jgi:hypothetical protein